MSLDSVELIMAWEEEFGISISDEEASNLVTPRLAIDLITKKIHEGLSTKMDRSTDREKVRNVLRSITRAQLGIGEFSDDDNFVRNLGVD